MFDLGEAKVRISVDDQASKELAKLKNEIKATESFTDKHAKSISAVGKIATATTVATAGAVASLTKKVVESYGTYEQLTGGVEKLFGKSSEQVMKYADEAYTKAGMSANQYMENITSFSASLIQGLGGDTAKAAEIGNMAVQDMSDNVNVFGSHMEDIQRTYQSLARGNYGMLDNLKLGYGGTKAEMERLLKDAEKLTGIKYDISNFSDIIQAIHVVQEEMNITGTTAKESANTVEGSVNTMKAAWDNWITSLGTGSADKIQETTDGLIKSFKQVGKNIVPVVGNVLKAMKPLVALMGAGTLVSFTSKALLAESALVKFQAANKGVSVATGIMNGSISASEGILGSLAQKTSLTSNLLKAMPWAAAATGAALLGFAIKEAYDSTHKYRQEVDELEKSHRDNVAAVEANANAADFYLGRIDELMAKDHRTAQEKKLLAQYCKQVNDAVGENVIKYDEESDSLNKNTDKVRENIEAKKQAALANVYAKNYEESLEKQVELEKKRAEAAEEFHSAEANYNREVQSGNVSKLTQDRYNQTKAALNDVKGAYRSAKTEAGYWAKAMEKGGEAAEKSGKKSVQASKEAKRAAEENKTAQEKAIEAANKQFGGTKKQTVKVDADTSAAEKKLAKTQNKRVAGKTFTIDAEDKATEKVNKVEKEKVKDKKFDINADDNASKKVESIDNKDISNKSFSINATLTGLSAKVKSFLGLRKGKREIPYDGFLAELHKGERVLTAPEVNQYDAILKSVGEKALKNRQLEQTQMITNNDAPRYTVYIDGAKINDDYQIQTQFKDMMTEMARRGLM